MPPPASSDLVARSSLTHDVLCAGLVCVDLVLAVPHHPAPDEKLRAFSRLVAPGGPAAVAAAQIARLGGRAAFAGLIGDDASDPFAPLLRCAFAADHIDVSTLVSVRADTLASPAAAPGFETPLSAILVKPDATRSVVSHRAQSQITSQTMIDVAPFAPPFPCACVVLVDGHRPEWSAALVAHARACSAPLVLDAGSWSDSVRALAPHADHLVASEACARAALADLPGSPGEHDPTAASPAELRAALHARPDAEIVVTLGPRGLVWHPAAAARGDDLHSGLEAMPAFPVEAIDTTGAGDAFHGAYALGLARGLPRMEMLRLASAAGALACTRAGAWPALARTEEIYDLLGCSPGPKWAVHPKARAC